MKTKDKETNSVFSNIKNVFKIIILALLLLFVYYTAFGNTISGATAVTYNDFTNMIENDQISNVKISDDTIYVISNVNGKEYKTMNLHDEKLIDKLTEKNIKFEGVQNYSIIERIVRFSIDVVIIVGVFYLLYYMYLSYKNKKKLFDSVPDIYTIEKKVRVNFDNIAGQQEAKESLQEFINYLDNSTKYTKIGARLPKGCLLIGPQGTGKTLLAKAVAGEAGVPIISLSGSDFIEMFLSTGTSRIHDLFNKAKSLAPCIIFIDEIDIICQNNNNNDNDYNIPHTLQSKGNNEKENILNQLLKEIDSYDSSKNIIILGATSKPELLDKSLMRPGRLDKKINIDNPNIKDRIEILKLHAKNVELDDDVDFNSIALTATGGTGADLASIINEAALRAVRLGKSKVSQEDIMESVETVIASKINKNKILCKEERTVVAYHEIGHALVSAVLKGVQSVKKITIVPKPVSHLGYTMYYPESGRYLSTKKDVIIDVITLLGGRATEDVIFTDITNGSSNDIEKATNMIREFVTVYGMSSLGLVCFVNPYNDTMLNCSETYSAKIDYQVSSIISKCYDLAKEIISKNIDLIDVSANKLLKEESINGKDFKEIYDEYINGYSFDVPDIIIKDKSEYPTSIIENSNPTNLTNNYNKNKNNNNNSYVNSGKNKNVNIPIEKENINNASNKNEHNSTISNNNNNKNTHKNNNKKNTENKFKNNNNNQKKLDVKNDNNIQKEETVIVEKEDNIIINKNEKLLISELDDVVEEPKRKPILPIIKNNKPIKSTKLSENENNTTTTNNKIKNSNLLENSIDFDDISDDDEFLDF